MATATFKDKQRNALLKKYHTLCGRVGLDDYTRRMMLVQHYNVVSSSDLDVNQLFDACAVLDAQLNPKAAELDKSRKRLIASVGGWLRLIGYEQNTTINKAIATRAAKRKNFNDIPLEQLRNLYATFNKKQRDFANVEELTIDILDYLSTYN